MNINFAEFSRQYQKYQTEYENAALRVLRSGWYILGKELENFEKNYSEFHQTKFCVGVGNGLDALRLALGAVGVGSEDEVIVQTNTFIATALAITENHAKPVFVDADHFFGIDPFSIEKAITSKTKAIMVVHLYGQMCDMDPILDIAKKHRLFVIEDCAQSHGARYKGRLAGTLGDVGCFSFYPMKPVGALGDAGAIITDNEQIALKVRMLRNYGSQIKYKHEILGINSRLDEIQAAMLCVSLKHILEGNEERGKIAKKYLEGIKNPKVALPEIRPNSEHVFHVFAIRCEERESLFAYLQKNGIHVQIHYPIPCHRAECYKELGYKKGDFPLSEKIANEEISLPIYVGLSNEEIKYIIDIINQY